MQLQMINHYGNVLSKAFTFAPFTVYLGDAEVAGRRMFPLPDVSLPLLDWALHYTDPLADITPPPLFACGGPGEHPLGLHLWQLHPWGRFHL